MPPRPRRPILAARRLHRVLARRGLVGTVREALHHVARLPARRRAARMEAAFDAHHEVDTAGVVRLDELAIDSHNKAHGVRYQGSDPRAFRALMRSVEMAAGELTFIDLGAGKGRALIMAAELPFRRIIGVEFSPELCDVARANAVRAAAGRPDGPPIEVVCADVLDFELPGEPSLLYLYNPFTEPVVEALLRSVARSLEDDPRRLVVACLGRRFDASLLERAGLEPIARVGAGELFAATPRSARAHGSRPASAQPSGASGA